MTGDLRERLVRLAYRFVWNRHDAEEIAHDAVAKSLVHANRLRNAGRWWPWICRIVVHRCREVGRSRRRWKRHANAYRSEVAPSQVSDGAPCGSGASDDRAELLHGLLAELPDRQREVLVLRHLNEMNYDEIGEVLGISPSTARVHAQNGRERLRELLLALHPAWFE